jgi:hypothetical protein
MNDDALRIFVYDRLVSAGHAPTSREIGAHFDLSPEDARARLAGLKIGKTVLVNPTTHEIWMAGPFAAAKSAYRLSDGKTTWWANCAWDMFGVAMIVGRPMTAETSCPDCAERVAIECDPDHPPVEGQAVVHFLLPARRWYEDIGFT